MKSLQYQGGMAVVMRLPSGKVLQVAPGDVVELESKDFKALNKRADWGKTPAAVKE